MVVYVFGPAGHPPTGFGVTFRMCVRFANVEHRAQCVQVMNCARNMVDFCGRHTYARVLQMFWFPTRVARKCPGVP